MQRVLGLPLIVLVMGMGAASMLLPAAHAFVVKEAAVARAFLHSGLLFMVLSALIGVAVSGHVIRRQAKSHLVSLLATFVLLPLMLAVPFAEAVPGTAFSTAYFEMVSSLTTTGATYFAAESLPGSVHLWRALVGWEGGFFVWVTAVAIFAPMNLGGFEVRAAASGGGAPIGRDGARSVPVMRAADPSERLARFAARLAPVYAGLTGVLWMALIVAGASPLTAVCHAMSTLATSGITPLARPADGNAGFAGEVVIALFLLFALSRLTFAADERADGWRALRRDPELRLGLSLVVLVTLMLTFRHWLGAIEVSSEGSTYAVVETLWGAAFTVLSFLTTAGFESQYWDVARNWSGLTSPGLILMGLAVFGGGVATTAGGVKLLRVHALYRHGVRELEKLVHPHSVGGSGQAARQVRRQGAYVAWIFFMLFAISIAGVMTAFAATGEDFEAAMILTVASLTTTGPLVDVVGSVPVNITHLSDAGRLIFAAAMVVGRLETLVIIALLNPDFWRS